MNESRMLKASLILTVLNEAASLPRFFASLNAMNEIPEEVVVVDGGSTDETLRILEDLKGTVASRLVIRQLAGCGISEGRNLAIKVAGNEVILVSDGGTELSPNWAGDLVRTLDDCQVASGFFEPKLEEPLGFPGILATIITPNLLEIDEHRFLPSSRSIALKKDAWSQVGGYPEWLDYCEDLVFDLSLKRAGFKFKFVPQATVTWNARSNMRTFAKQYYRYARGDGKAALWPKRHAARYAAYGGGSLFLLGTFFTPLSWIPLIIGTSIYVYRPVSRVIRARRMLRMSGVIRALALIPPVVVLGDLAKMAGYPAGKHWRRHNAQLVNAGV